MEQIEARGVNFIYAKEFLQSMHGEDNWQQLVEALSPESKAVWSGMLMAIGSYPFASFKELVGLASTKFHGTKDEEISQMYEYTADRSLNKLYKVFFRMASPSFVISNYPKLWQKFFTSGDVVVPVSEKGHAVLEFQLNEIFLDWLPPACRGFSNKAVSMAGGKNMKMNLQSRDKKADGDWTIVYELHWEE